MNNAQILIVDDDHDICQLLKDYIEPFGFRVLIAHDGHEMWRAFKQHNIDLVVLDVMLPGEDGISLCRKIREQSSVSIIMLSAAGDEADRIVGLEVGADDYLAKPFSSRELLARIKALLRRAKGKLGEKRRESRLASLPNLQFLDWQLDQTKRRLIASDDVTIPLTSGEFDLLLAFMQHAGRVLTRDQLLDMLHGRSGGPFDRSIDVQVGRLRKKIENDPKDPKIILTVRGGGYQFTAKVTESDD